MATRREFSREFKLEAVRLVKERGVTAAQAARDLDVHENVLRKWVRELAADPQQAFPGKGVMKPEQAEIDRLRKEVAKLKMERDILKNRLRGLPRPICVETSGAYTGCAPGQWPLAFWRRMSPSKNLAQGKLRTQLWWHCA